MKKGIFAAVAAFAVLSGLSVLAVADDAKKEGDKSAPVYSVQCDSPCSFTVSGHDKKEVVAVVIEHAKTHHNMTLTEKDVEGMVKTTMPAR
jgi:predicted small metal-binding protein